MQYTETTAEASIHAAAPISAEQRNAIIEAKVRICTLQEEFSNITEMWEAAWA